MRLLFCGCAYPCARAEKDTQAAVVRAFDEAGRCVFEAKGVTDFSLFSLEGGAWAFPSLSVEARVNELEDLMASLLFGGDAL